MGLLHRHKPIREEWQLGPPPPLELTSVEIEQARAQLRRFQDWTTAAVLHLRHVVAVLRARGRVRNLSKLIESYAEASRQSFESRSMVLGLAENMKKIARDLRVEGEKYAAGNYPEFAPQFFEKADEADIRADIMSQSADCHLTLVEAYSEVLKGLAGVEEEGSGVDVVSFMLGPAMGGALLAGLVSPTVAAIVVGTILGATAGVARYSEVVRREGQ